MLVAQFSSRTISHQSVEWLLKYIFSTISYCLIALSAVPCQFMPGSAAVCVLTLVTGFRELNRKLMLVQLPGVAR